MKKQGFFQALGVTTYIGLVGLFINNAEQLVGNLGLPFGPILMLLLLSVSVLVCAVLVLYKPYKLFIDGKKNEALKVVTITTIWLLVFLLVGFTSLMLLK